MKLSAKQIDEIVRLMGTMAASALAGAAIGFARPEQVTHTEVASLAAAFAVSFAIVLMIRTEK
jgi:hypothetical protein